MLSAILRRVSGLCPPEYSPSRCLRTGGHPCQRCVDTCTSGAVTVTSRNSPPHLDAATCNGCLTCTGSCPAGAFRHPQPVLMSWAMGLGRGHKPLPVSCGRIFTPGRAWIPCAGGFTYPVLTYLTALGEGLVLTVGKCVDCEYGRGGTAFKHTMGRANEALSRLEPGGPGITLRCASESKEAAGPMSRRMFLGAELAKTLEVAQDGLCEMAVSVGPVWKKVQAEGLETMARRFFLQRLRSSAGDLPSHLFPFRVLRKRGAGEREARFAAKRCLPGAIEITGEGQMVHHRDLCRPCTPGPCPVWPEAPLSHFRDDPADQITIAGW